MKKDTQPITVVDRLTGKPYGYRDDSDSGIANDPFSRDRIRKKQSRQKLKPENDSDDSDDSVQSARIINWFLGNNRC